MNKESPGKFPYKRGIYREMYKRRTWTMRQYAGFTSSEESNQRFLKLLEEPPEKTYFILISEDEQLLLPTIISRCQLLEIKPIEPNVLIQKIPNNKLRISGTFFLIMGFLIVWYIKH